MRQLDEAIARQNATRQLERDTAALNDDTNAIPEVQTRDSTLDQAFLTSPTEVAARAAAGLAYDKTITQEERVDTPVQPTHPSLVVPLSNSERTRLKLCIVLDFASVEESTRDCVRQLILLHDNLGRPSTTGNEFTLFSSATTAKAVRDIKTLLAEPNVNSQTRDVLNTYRSHLASVRWRFEDVYDAFRFLKTYGRDEIFNKQRLSIIQFLEPGNCKRAECCELPNRESQFRCDSPADGCLICVSLPHDLHQFYDERLPSDLRSETQSIFTLDGMDALYRPACPHAQSDRFFYFLASRIMNLDFDPGRRHEILRLRSTVMRRWQDRQRKWGWTFPDHEFPPKDKAQGVMIHGDDGLEVQYTFEMKNDADTGKKVLSIVWVGNFEQVV